MIIEAHTGFLDVKVVMSCALVFTTFKDEGDVQQVIAFIWKPFEFQAFKVRYDDWGYGIPYASKLEIYVMIPVETILL